MIHHPTYFGVFALFLLSLAPALFSINLNLEIDLHCCWAFEIGDNLEFARPDFNDSKWVSVKVPGAWENEGFPGFDGYGWYRISFVAPKHLKNKVLYLNLGQIDDVDRTYFNGQLVGGKGDFPPSYQTAYDVNRLYQIPANFVHFGKKNVVAVRIYDQQGAGGIVHGDIGVYSREDVIDLRLDLSGMWKFKTGDAWEWAGPDYDDKNWKLIAVPGFWEEQGYARHDGCAWYRKTVSISKSVAQEKLILLLGKINDLDEVYFNGAKIGETGIFPRAGEEIPPKSFKDEERAYFIPPYLIQTNKANLLAVRVYDYGHYGGIYSGYVGISTRENYLKYTRKKK